MIVKISLGSSNMSNQATKDQSWSTELFSDLLKDLWLSLSSTPVVNGHSSSHQDKQSFAQSLKSICLIAGVFIFIFINLDTKLKLMSLATLSTKKSELTNLNNGTSFWSPEQTKPMLAKSISELEKTKEWER